MNDDLLQRISKTKWEIYPLDRMLPKETVLNLFLEKYRQLVKKSSLAKNSRLNKRLREGYWSLFACVALDLMEQSDHFIFFPDDDRNDVSFISPNDLEATRPKMNFIEFDVKEYTCFSAKAGFGNFIQTVINPSRKIYGVIVGVHENVGLLHAESLFSTDDSDRGVFLIAQDKPDDKDEMEAHVLFIMGNKLLFDRTVSLTEFISSDKAQIVYQDKLKGLPR